MAPVALAAPYVYVSNEHGVDAKDIVDGRLHDRWATSTWAGRATLNHDHTRLYVFDLFAPSLMIIDTRSAAVLHTVPLAGRPLEIAIPTNDAQVYVGVETAAAGLIAKVQYVDVQAGSVIRTEQVPYSNVLAVNPAGTTLYLEDRDACLLLARSTATFMQTASTASCTYPGAIAVSPDGTRVYGNTLTPLGALWIYDATTLSPLGGIALPWSGGYLDAPMAVRSDGAEVLVGGVAQGQIAFVDVVNGRLDDVAPVCGFPTGLSYGPDERLVYALCDGFMSDAVVDAHTHALLSTAPFSYYASAHRQFVGAPPVSLYVANRSSASVASIEPGSNIPVPLAAVGAEPEGIVESRDGRLLYVSNGLEDTVTVVDVVDHVVLATIPVGDHPTGVALSPDGSRLYVANMDADSVSIVDIASRAVVDELAFEPHSAPRSIAVAHDGSKVYIGLSAWSYIEVYDVAGDNMDPPIYLPWGAAGIVMSPDGSALYATAYAGDAVYKIDAASQSIVATWPVGSYVLPFLAPLAISPDGGRLYVGTKDSDLSAASEAMVAILDTANGNLLAWVPIAGTPASIVADTEDRFVYVAIPGSDSVQVIDTRNSRIARTLTGFQAPTAIALPVEPPTNLLFADGFEGAE